MEVLQLVQRRTFHSGRYRGGETNGKGKGTGRETEVELILKMGWKAGRERSHMGWKIRL
jgi:hypothetical protein